MSNSLCRFQYGAIRIMAGRRARYRLGIDEAILTGVLDFSFQKIGDGGATALGVVLRNTNTSLRELSLTYNNNNSLYNVYIKVCIFICVSGNSLFFLILFHAFNIRVMEVEIAQ